MIAFDLVEADLASHEPYLEATLESKVLISNHCHTIPVYHILFKSHPQIPKPFLWPGSFKDCAGRRGHQRQPSVISGGGEQKMVWCSTAPKCYGICWGKLQHQEGCSKISSALSWLTGEYFVRSSPILGQKHVGGNTSLGPRMFGPV